MQAEATEFCNFSSNLFGNNTIAGHTDRQNPLPLISDI